MAENKAVAQKLISAFQDGKLEESICLIKELKKSFLSSWSPGFNLLCQALKNKHLEIAKVLVSHNCLLKIESQKTTALHVAALYGDAKIIQMIRNRKKTLKNCVKRICSTRDVDENGMTALHLFAKRRPVDQECSEVLDQLLLSLSKINDPHGASGFTPLHFAAECGNLEMISLLLRKNAQVDSKAKQDETPLHIAIANGHAEILRELLKHKADPNAVRICPTVSKNQKRSSGYTSLHIAAEKGNLEIFKILHEHGVKPDAVDELCRTPLHIAIRNGSLSIVIALLNTNCEISSFCTQEKPDGYSPLHVAVEVGNEHIVKLLLDKGISADSTTQKGYTCLHLAARKGNTALVRLFQELHANSDVAGLTAIETPLFFAAESGCLETVEILYEAINCKSEEWLEGYASLFVAAYRGHENIVQMMLEKGVNPNSIFGKYLTPLHAAALMGHATIVNLLLEQGVDVNPKEDDEVNKRFSTPLIAASLSGHKAIVKILLDRGADKNVRISSKPEEVSSEAECLLTYGYYSHSEVVSAGYNLGYMPIHFGVVSGKKEIVEMLLEKGADVNAEGIDGETPLYVAVEHQYKEIVAFLLEKGANADAEKSGQSVLLKAISANNLEIVKMLLRFKAPVNKISIINEKSYTPLQLAVIKSTPENSQLHSKKRPLNVKPEITPAIERNESIIRTLIAHGASLDSHNSEGFTPLFLALKNCNMRVFKLLLKKGASIHVKTTQGMSLLQFAIDNYFKLNDIRFIVEFGANLDDNELNLSSIESKHDDCAKLFNILCNSHLDVNSHIDCFGKTILHRACDAKRSDIVELLLKQDVNLNIVDKIGHTAFWYSVHEACSAWDVFYHKVIQAPEEEWVASNNLNTVDFSAYKIDKSLRTSAREFITTTKEYVKIARLLTQEVAKLKAAGKYLNEQNAFILKTDFVKDYDAHCQAEILKLKDEKILKSVSYFDVLIASEIQLVTYARNLVIKKSLRSLNHKFLFYENMLKARFERGEERRFVMQLAASLLNQSSDLKMTSHLMDRVFNYLHMIDLKNVCRACKPYIFVN